MIQLETRSEKLSPSILTRGSSQSEEGRGRIEKNLFSARELSPHLRNCDKFTSAQKEPIRARHNARLRAQPREKRQTQRKLIDVNVASNLRLQHTLWDFAEYKMQTNTKHKKRILTLLGPGGGHVFAYNDANTRTSVLKKLDFSLL